VGGEGSGHGVTVRGGAARAAAQRPADRGGRHRHRGLPGGAQADPDRVGRHRADQRPGLPAGGPGRALDQLLHVGDQHRPGRAGPRPHRLPDAARPRRGHRPAHLRARPQGVQVPVRLRRAPGPLGGAGDRQRLLRPGRVRAPQRHLPEHQLRPVEAGSGQGRPGGDLPPAPRRAVDEDPVRGPGAQGGRAAGHRLDVRPHPGVVRPPRRPQAAQGAGRLPAQGPDQRPAAPDLDVGHGAALRGPRLLGPGPP
jgi:hypothetical protein